MAPVHGRRPPLLLTLLQFWLLLPHGLLADMAQFVITPNEVVDSATPLASVPVLNVLRCAILCRSQPSCLAFNQRSSGLCEMFSGDQVCQESGAVVPLTAEPGGRFVMLRDGCGSTCLQLLRRSPAATSGVYQLAGWTVPVYCDQELDGGGWTLMVSSVSQTWTPDDTLTLVTGRNQETPSIEDDYSILAEGDRVLSFGTGDRFLYRLEGLTETGRQQWGGIWSAPRSGSLVRHAPDVTTQMVTRFSDWTDNTERPENRLPWINTGYFPGNEHPEFVLTTSADASYWGTLITRPSGGWQHSPWMHNVVTQSGNVLYWIRENE